MRSRELRLAVLAAIILFYYVTNIQATSPAVGFTRFQRAKAQESTTTQMNSTASKENTTTTQGNNTASEENTTATQGNTTASRENTTTTQMNTPASEESTTATQVNATASEENTTTTQMNTPASEESTTATQGNTTASRENTTATQMNTTASEENTTTTQVNATASEENTTATQVNTPASEESTAILQHSATPDMSLTEDLKFETRDSDEPGSQFFTIMYVTDDYIMIGGRSNYYNISLYSFNMTSNYTWTPQPQHLELCLLGHPGFHIGCHSYVQGMERVLTDPHGPLWVCASGARYLEWQAIRFTNEGVWEGYTESRDSPAGLNSYVPWLHRLTFRTREDVLWVMGSIYEDPDVKALVRNNVYHPNGTLQRAGLRTPVSFFNTDGQKSLSKPYAIFDMPQYMYGVFTELAKESYVQPGVSPRDRARIVRVCKNDRYRGGDEYEFTTAVKATLMCHGYNSDFDPPELQNQRQRELPSYYKLQLEQIGGSSEAHESSLPGTAGEPVFITMFNSPKSTFESGYIGVCIYKVSDVDRRFRDRKYFDCPQGWPCITRSYPEPIGRCLQDDEWEHHRADDGVYLMYDPIYPVGERFLHLSYANYKITDLKIDWQIYFYNVTYDVIFAATDTGKVIKLVYYENKNEFPQYHIVEERDVLPNTKIFQMKLLQLRNGQKCLLLNNHEAIKRIPLVRCSDFVNCSRCLFSGKPYCVWVESSSACLRYPQRDAVHLIEQCPTVTTSIPTTLMSSTENTSESTASTQTTSKTTASTQTISETAASTQTTSETTASTQKASETTAASQAISSVETNFATKTSTFPCKESNESLTTREANDTIFIQQPGAGRASAAYGYVLICLLVTVISGSITLFVGYQWGLRSSEQEAQAPMSTTKTQSSEQRANILEEQ